ncbi:MAG: UDP-N-acetylmuramoyl-tripeptide--D-alanyl-D-alanine ligase, partial [Flavobacteriales bacterium]|nr:UDP-N-acetylmuramoyl-tripeptide--D-alanyl-D-alanine ligase [Flavobacteriales bacterium]
MREQLLERFLESGRVCTDTRNIVEGSIFFALKGANFNGNEYAHQALQDGCSYAVIDEEKHAHDRCILVDDVLSSLQQLALDFRNSFDIPVVGITGSNGKTTTKELMAAVLEQKFRVHVTQGNFNNHIGVPLTLLAMPLDSEIAVIEMGANHQKEIAELCAISNPTHGLITNIGRAHLEGFGGIEGVKKGKGELFDHLRATNGIAFVNTSAKHLSHMATGLQTEEYASIGGHFALEVLETDPTVVFTSKLSPNPVRTQ